MVITILVAVLGSNGLWAFLQWYITNRKKKRSTEQEALLALLHDKLYALCKSLLSQDSISLEQLENLEYLYRPYIKLGGNGTCEKLYRQVIDMPITK